METCKNIEFVIKFSCIKKVQNLHEYKYIENISKMSRMANFLNTISINKATFILYS